MSENHESSKVKNLFYTLNANIISLLAGVLATFFIPKMLSIESYAYFKLFTFYLGYIGIFHFGFCDGIYIKYGNYDYEDLPKKKFRTYFRFLLILEIAVALILSVILTGATNNPERKIIFIFLAINLIIQNLICYFDYISQITKRFKNYSFNLIIAKTIYILGIISYFFVNKNNALYFILLQTLVNLIIFFIYVRQYKDLIVGKKESFKSIKSDIKENFFVGFLVMIGNFMGIFIIGVDRFCVDKFFTIDDFAMYSFAASLLAMFYLIINAITMFIYPYLSRSSNDDIKNNYVKLKRFIFMIVGFSLIAYFIFKIIVIKFIPKYTNALRITEIIFPTILINAQINVVSANFYKTLKLQKDYTINNILAGIIAIVTIIIAIISFKTVIAVAYSSLIAFYLWGLYSDFYFMRKFKINLFSIHALEFVVIFIFLLVTKNFNWYSGMLIYFIVFLLILILFFRDDIKKLLSLVNYKRRC